MMSSCSLLLFFFTDGRADIINPPNTTILLFKCAKPLNPNPVISLPHSHWCPLLLRILCVRLHRVPSSASSACASIPARSSSTPAPRSSSTSKHPGTASSAQPSLPYPEIMPSHSSSAIGTTPPPPLSSPPHPGTAPSSRLSPSPGPRLPDLFHL
jgi:hypothetical protein